MGKIHALFEGVGANEKHHEARYKAMLKDVEEDAMFKKATSTVWICLNCGVIFHLIMSVLEAIFTS